MATNLAELCTFVRCFSWRTQEIRKLDMWRDRIVVVRTLVSVVMKGGNWWRILGVPAMSYASLFLTDCGFIEFELESVKVDEDS